MWSNILFLNHLKHLIYSQNPKTKDFIPVTRERCHSLVYMLRPQMIYTTPSSETFFVLLPQEERAHMAMDEQTMVKTFSLKTTCPPKPPSRPGNGNGYGELISMLHSDFLLLPKRLSPTPIASYPQTLGEHQSRLH